MELRVLKRRDLTGSMTIVGDMGQATTASSSASWNAVLEVLEPRREPTRVDLTVSYRTPEEVLDFAAPTLRAAAPDLTPPRPVRRAGHLAQRGSGESRRVRGDPGRGHRREVDAVAPGRVAVIVTGERVEEVVTILRSKGLDAIDPRDQESRGLGADLIVLSAQGANGLEFDGRRRGRTESDRQSRCSRRLDNHGARSTDSLRRDDAPDPTARNRGR